MDMYCRKGRIRIVVLTVVLAVPRARADLVAYWGFDDDSDPAVAREERGGKDGTLVGKPQRVPGRIGKALRLDGIDDYVRIPRDPVFNIRRAITLAAWVKCERFEEAFATIIAKGDSAWRVSREKLRDVLHLGANAHDDWWYITGNTSVNDQKWHHVVSVFDGEVACLYVDGELDAVGETTAPFCVNDFDVCIGENAEVPGRHWKGLIDDVLVLDHSLTAAQVKELYGKGARALVAEELGILSGTISQARIIWARQGPEAAIAFLRRILAEAERRQAQRAEAGRSYRMLMSELYFQLARVQTVVEAPAAEIIPSYRRAVTVCSWSHQYVPALLWLFRQLRAEEYAALVAESIRGSPDPWADVRRVAVRFQESANWPAFEAYLDAAVPQVTDPMAFAQEIGRGLADQPAWTESFVQYCRSRPALRPYYLFVRLARVRESEASGDFVHVAEMYRAAAAECTAREDPTVFELGLCTYLFESGQYHQALGQIEQFVTKPGAADRPETRNVRLLQGRVCLQLGELDQAVEAFSRVTEAGPADEVAAEAGFLAGYCRMRLGDADQARRTLAAVTQRYPKSTFASKARLCLSRLERGKP
jgi:tetratricopeptide (TPR) repeat protein